VTIFFEIFPPLLVSPTKLKKDENKTASTFKLLCLMLSFLSRDRTIEITHWSLLPELLFKEVPLKAIHSLKYGRSHSSLTKEKNNHKNRVWFGNGSKWAWLTVLLVFVESFAVTLSVCSDKVLFHSCSADQL
jgi:hypothetical protein